MKTKMYENYEIYEAPTAEVHDLEVELVYLEDNNYDMWYFYPRP